MMAPEPETGPLRRDLSRLLDTLYGLHYRPGHLDAVLEVVNLHAIKALEVSAPSASRAPDGNQIADTCVQQVAELPDRTSPDDWPEAMLVTADELRSIVREAVASQTGVARAPEPAEFCPACGHETFERDELDKENERLRAELLGVASAFGLPSEAVTLPSCAHVISGHAKATYEALLHAQTILAASRAPEREPVITCVCPLCSCEHDRLAASPAPKEGQ